MPPSPSTESKTMDQYLKEYLEQLSDIEKTVLKIAQEHLETSFSLEKSIGFKEWYSKNKNS
jgi:hypothetical protein